MYEQLKKEVLESLINLVVLDQYSQKLGIVVDGAHWWKNPKEQNISFRL